MTGSEIDKLKEQIHILSIELASQAGACPFGMYGEKKGMPCDGDDNMCIDGYEVCWAVWAKNKCSVTND